MVRHTLKRQDVLCWIKELYQDTRLARKQSVYSNATGQCPLMDEVMFIDREPYGYTRRVKEAIPKRLYPDNINEDSGIEILEVWMPTSKQHNTHSVLIQTTYGTISFLNDKDINTPIMQQHPRRGSKCTNHRQPRGYKYRHIYSECTQSPDEDQQYSGCHVVTHALSYCDTIVRQTTNSAIITFKQ